MITLDIQTDKCYFCGSDAYDDDAIFCYNCGISLTNVCLNDDCKHHGDVTELIAEAKFCPYCGSETLFHKESDAE